MPREHKYIREVDQVWYGQPHYKQSLIVPEINVKSIQRNPYLGKKAIVDLDYDELMSFIKKQGICDVGFTKLEQQHMFKDSIALFKYAIVFTMEMKHGLQ